MNFCFWWNKHVLEFLSKNQKVSETSFFNFKIIPVTQRSFVFTWSFFSSNSRVGEKSRESSFLLHRSTKLKHTDSISVPSHFYCGRKRVPRKRQFSKSGTFYPNFFNYFFKFFSATFVTFWIGIRILECFQIVSLWD
jgi:hypothetical protein